MAPIPMHLVRDLEKQLADGAVPAALRRLSGMEKLTETSPEGKKDDKSEIGRVLLPVKEEEKILRDIRPISNLAKRLIRSTRPAPSSVQIAARAKDTLRRRSYYFEGESLKAGHEKAVREKLLAYHPHYEDKIGCGLQMIIVNQHPVYWTRCFFVVRTDGGCEDFSYKKCLRSYIRSKYPSYAESFIEKHQIELRASSESVSSSPDESA